MALRQYATKVATPHPLRGGSPLGEPKSFGGSPKGTLIGDIPLKKVAHRKVVSHARSRIKNQSTPFSQETSAGFGWKPT